MLLQKFQALDLSTFLNLWNQKWIKSPLALSLSALEIDLETPRDPEFGNVNPDVNTMDSTWTARVVPSKMVTRRTSNQVQGFDADPQGLKLPGTCVSSSVLPEKCYVLLIIIYWWSLALRTSNCPQQGPGTSQSWSWAAGTLCQILPGPWGIWCKSWLRTVTVSIRAGTFTFVHPCQ